MIQIKPTKPEEKPIELSSIVSYTWYRVVKDNGVGTDITGAVVFKLANGIVLLFLNGRKYPEFYTNMEKSRYPWVGVKVVRLDNPKITIEVEG